MTEATENIFELLSPEIVEKVIHAVPGMIFIIDQNYIIRRVLNCDPGKLSVPADDIIGRAIYNGVDKNCVEEVLGAIDRALASDEVQEVGYTIAFGDSIQYFEGRFKRIQNNLVACFECNVTQRKAGEAEIDRMQRINRLVLEYTNSGFVYIDNNYMVQWENVGRDIEVEIASKYKVGTYCFREVMGRTSPCDFCVADKALRTGKIEQMDFVVNESLYVEVTASPVYDENHQPMGAVLKYDDVTIQRKSAEELRVAKEAAETSDQLKSMFISNMSHEIRTPLNAIVGFSDLLSVTDDPREKAEFISIIKHNNELLLQLVNDILDLSKIEANSLDLVYGNVDVHELFEEMEMTLTGFAADVDADVKLSFISSAKDCVIYAEKNRIRQVLMHMINNAFMFTAEGEVNVGYEQQEEIIRFYVQDTGIGIPADKQDDIFNRFVKLDTFTRGAGLGLYICQTIIRKLGGTIGVDSTPGEGSTFWFTLPAKQAD